MKSCLPGYKIIFLSQNPMTTLLIGLQRAHVHWNHSEKHRKTRCANLNPTPTFRIQNNPFSSASWLPKPHCECKRFSSHSSAPAWTRVPCGHQRNHPKHGEKLSLNKSWICFHYLATESITWYIVGRHLCFGPFFASYNSRNSYFNSQWKWIKKRRVRSLIELLIFESKKQSHVTWHFRVIVTSRWYHDLQTWRWTLCMLERCQTIKQ